MGSIICGVDGTKSAARAVNVARALGAQLGLRLVFVRVVALGTAEEETAAIAEQLEELSASDDWLIEVGHPVDPFGRSFMLVAETDGRIVGLRAFMRWEFVAGDRRFRAVRAVDTATHPDHQGKGIFSRLTLEALDSLRDQADFIFNTPNEKSLPGYLKMGWSDRRPRADPDPCPAPDPVRDPGAVVAFGERARRCAGGRRAPRLRSCWTSGSTGCWRTASGRPASRRRATGVPALAIRRPRRSWTTER